MPCNALWDPESIGAMVPKFGAGVACPGIQIDAFNKFR